MPELPGPFPERFPLDEGEYFQTGRGSFGPVTFMDFEPTGMPYFSREELNFADLCSQHVNTIWGGQQRHARTSPLADDLSSPQGIGAMLPPFASSLGDQPQPSHDTDRDADVEPPEFADTGQTPLNEEESPDTRGVGPFVCPYAKYDPQRYSGRSLNDDDTRYRNCANCILRDITRLKQHLWRVHTRPIFFCPCCFRKFSTEAARDNHNSSTCRSRTCPYNEKMTHEMERELRKRKATRDPIEAWFRIYGILFPNSPMPKDPFPEDVSVAIQNFRSSLAQKLPALLLASMDEIVQGRITRNEQHQVFTRASLQQHMEDVVNQVLTNFWRPSLTSQETRSHHNHTPTQPSSLSSSQVSSSQATETTTSTTSLRVDRCCCLGKETASFFLDLIYQGLNAFFFLPGGDRQWDQEYMQSCIDALKRCQHAK